MPTKRIASIDAFRGFAILTMVLANYLAGVQWVPAWLKHAPDVGLTVIDLIAPFFIFAIGLTYGLSARRRIERDGWLQTASHFGMRYLAILGLGALISTAEFYFGQSDSIISWGVLQAIGMAGLVTLAFIRLPAWARAVAGLAILGIYQVLLNRYWLGTVLASSHGGLLGAISWSGMLLLATALADSFHRRNADLKTLIGLAALALVAGLALTPWAPVSKNRVSASYVLVSLAASGLIYAAFVLLVDRLGLNLRLLSAWGKNPILLYFLHLVLLGIVVLPGIPAWYAQAPLWLVLLQAAGLAALLSWIAWRLARDNRIVSF